MQLCFFVLDRDTGSAYIPISSTSDDGSIKRDYLPLHLTIMTLRLLHTANCLHYDLTFTVDPKSEEFQCDEVISLEIVKASDNLELNVQNLKITSAKWNGTAVDFSIDELKHLLVIHKELVVGDKADLSVLCTGTFSHDMYGVYKSSYEDEDDDGEEENDEEDQVEDDTSDSGGVEKLDAAENSNANLTLALSAMALSNEKAPAENAEEGSAEDNYLVSTQFEPIGARRAFPCIDDPARKSHFTITLVHPTALVALLNSPVAETQSIDSFWLRTKFEKSPLMSTYLVAFVVGDLESLKSDKYPMTIWTLPGGAEDAYFALEAAEQCLPFYEEIFDYKLPLKKLDLVAIPDFAKSAMENFGLITFKESDLLIGPNAAQYRKEVVFETVAHEISHQWFGNLVTMDFWDDLWLNEGFATWMLWYAMDHFHPDWNVWENYIIYTLLTAFLVDGRASAHPIIMQIKSFNDIEQAGDEITYKKGCAIVVMLFNFLGKDVLFAGLRKYIQKFAWENAKSADLWGCLEEVSGEKIDSLMECWVSRPGYPIISVEELENGKLRLTQKRYLSSGETDNHCKPYIIPLTIESSEGPLKLVFDDETMELQVPEGSYYLNPDHFGYYVTSYPSTRWVELAKLETSTKDRIGTLLDCEMASSAGEILVIPFLQLAEQFATIENATLFDAIIESYFDLMDAFLADEKLWTGLCNFGQSMIGKHVSSCYVKSEDDSDNDSQFKGSVLRFAAFVRAPEINQYCDDQYSNFIDNDELLDPEEARIIFRNIVRRRDGESWNSLWEVFQKEKDEYTKEDILASLGNTGDKEVLLTYLDYILHSELIKPQDMLMCLVSISNTMTGVDLLWKWLRENWDELSTKLEKGSVIHLAVIGSCIGSLCTEEHLKQLNSFFADKDEVFESMVTNLKEKVKSKIAKFERNKIPVTEWLAGRNLLVD